MHPERLTLSIHRLSTARAALARLAMTVMLALVVGLPGCGGSGDASADGTITVGCKDFPEQFILGEMMAQLIESHTDLTVQRRFNLGGTMVCHNALVQGNIDVYAEYTGTALVSILPGPVRCTLARAVRFLLFLCGRPPRSTLADQRLGGDQ